MSSENKGSTYTIVKLKVKNITTIKALLTKALWVQLLALAVASPYPVTFTVLSRVPRDFCM